MSCNPILLANFDRGGTCTVRPLFHTTGCTFTSFCNSSSFASYPFSDMRFVFCTVLHKSSGEADDRAVQMLCQHQKQRCDTPLGATQWKSIDACRLKSEISVRKLLFVSLPDCSRSCAALHSAEPPGTGPGEQTLFEDSLPIRTTRHLRSGPGAPSF
jgi:hypothetical protein